MISIYDIKGWSDVAAFLIWTLAVCAIAKAVFGSLLTAELHYRYSLRDAPRRQRMNRLNWEINNRAAWNEDAARRSPHAAKQPLSDAEIESRRHELQQFARTSFAWRAIANAPLDPPVPGGEFSLSLVNSRNRLTLRVALGTRATRPLTVQRFGA